LNKLEPTYLRYVYDGLNKGFLNAENAAALPQGFIGLFESEFPADMSAVERISVLRRLSLWALFKSGVSTHLASEILEEDEEDTKTLIDTYSKWFNSPEPGKYILYHDRLRSYFLQKLSSHELQSLNEKLISYLEAALEANRKDEAEEYALTHLATHMVVESQLDNNYDRLHDFVNQEDIWKRQVKESKEYKWSQQAIQYGIKEGARRHHEMNTLTSTVNSVKLMQEEQNSAQQILDLLNEGDYQTALERALSFDGEKLFTIYLLMIHELTVGISKDASFKLESCKAVLKAIDENEIKIPTFPVVLIYRYYLNLKSFSLDYSVLIKQFNFNERDVLFLLEFDFIDISEIEYLVENFIHSAYYPEIYLRITIIFLNKKDKLKTQYYLETCQSLINNFEFSDGEYYNGIDKKSDALNYQVYYSTLIRWYIIISFVYYSIEDCSNSYILLKKILTIIDEAENTDIELKSFDDGFLHESIIDQKMWFDIFMLLIYLDKYDELVQMKQFHVFLDKSSYVSELGKVILEKRNIMQYKEFMGLLKEKNDQNKIDCLIDSFLVLCQTKQLEKANDIKKEINQGINNLEFGRQKFNACIKYSNVLLLSGNFFNGAIDLGMNIINHVVSLMNNLKDQNSTFYYGNAGEIIKILINNGNINKALEFYDIYFNEIEEKNINDPYRKHLSWSHLFTCLFSHDYKESKFIIEKAEVIINDKDYSLKKSLEKDSANIQELTFQDLIVKGFIEEAMLFATKYRVKLRTPPMNQYEYYGTTLVSRFDNRYQKNKKSFSFSIYGNHSMWGEYPPKITKKDLSHIDNDLLIDLLNITDDDFTFSNLIGELINRGFNNSVLKFIVKTLQTEKPIFNEISSGLQGPYRSILGLKTFLPGMFGLRSNYILINYTILKELSINMNWKKVDFLVDQFQFNNNLQNFPRVGEINNLDSIDELVFQRGFFNVKIKLLLSKLNKRKDPELINKLFEVCNNLSIDSNQREQSICNYNSASLLQIAHFFNHIGLKNEAVRAINESYYRKNNDTETEVPYNTQIITVMIKIYKNCLSHKDILIHFEELIQKNDYYKETEDKEMPEDILYHLLLPLVSMGEVDKANQLVNTILNIIEEIPIIENRMLIVDEQSGWELPNTDFARKQKMISKVSYFFYTIGDFDQGDKFYEMLSEELLYDSDSAYGDEKYQVGFDRNEFKSNYQNTQTSKLKETNAEKTNIDNEEYECNGVFYKVPVGRQKDKYSLEEGKEWNFDYCFKKSDDEFQLLSRSIVDSKSFASQTSSGFYSFLFYKAKMACFFEEEKDEQKLDLLSQVIDIDEWRKTSASI
jgi:hypothetical protein